jgi:hypothetical protein
MFDTIVAARILSNGLKEISNSLGPALEQYLGVQISKDLGDSDWGLPELTPAQLAYAAIDLHYLLPLRSALENALDEASLSHIADLENQLVPVVVDINLRGFAVDKPMLEVMLRECGDGQGVSGGKIKTGAKRPRLERQFESTTA